MLWFGTYKKVGGGIDTSWSTHTPLLVSLKAVVQKTVFYFSLFRFKFLILSSGIGFLASASVYGNGR